MQTTISVYAPAVYGNPSMIEELKERLEERYKSKPTISQNLSEGELYCMRCMVVTLCIMMRAVPFLVEDGDQTDVIQIEFYSDENLDEEIVPTNVVQIVREFDRGAHLVV